MTFKTPRYGVLPTLLAFLMIALAGCSEPSSPLETLAESDNYTMALTAQQTQDVVDQLLKVDGDKAYYSVLETSLYLHYQRGLFHFITGNETITAYLGQQGSDTYEKVELEEDPVESYIDLDALELSTHFERNNGNYRLNEAYLDSGLFKNLGSLNDVFLKFEDDSVTFTIFVARDFGEGTVVIAFTDIGETVVDLPS